ncbi:MAG: hypothetical protein A3D92_17015 [Bacteroidetes bacterium RIFCSPHIGHO2_02_FULL_44_7]|nr:MAG: hypothetical protein A3D92_17015 [Bacteroidetes bacterium RIFCSPHIGHO2_02_FULL_44_7]
MTLFSLFVFTGMSQAVNWEKLGSRVVDYRVERDVIPVGAQEGSFTKLKVAVKGGAINMHKMIVTYSNGTSETIALRHNFGPNGDSRIIDIAGAKRFIQKITFFYDTKNLAHSKAVVSVYGRH